MKVFYAVRDFLFPPVCPGCNEIFRIEYGQKNEFCPECKRKWELLKSNLCPDCGERFCECRCKTKALERSGVTALIKLVPYKKNRAVSNSTVLYIKKKRDYRVFGFLSEELAREIERYIKKIGIRREDAVIMFCPRRHRSVIEFGFDQAKLIADGVSGLTGIKTDASLKRISSVGRAQKKLDAKRRAKNVHGAFKLSSRANVKNKAVFLIDDLVTTGSTMAECARLIKGGGASLIIGVTVAYTEKDAPTE